MSTTRTNIGLMDFLKAAMAAKKAEDENKLQIEVDTEELEIDSETGLAVLDEDENEVYVKETKTVNAIEFIAHNTGLNEKTVEQKLTNLRNPEFKMEQYEDEDGNPVYLTGEREEVIKDGQPVLDDKGNVKTRYLRDENGKSVTTTDESIARKDAKGNLIRAERKAEDEDGNPIIVRDALPIPTFKRGGGGRASVESQMDEAMELLAQLNGVTVEELQAKQAKANQAAIKRATTTSES